MTTFGAHGPAIVTAYLRTVLLNELGSYLAAAQSGLQAAGLQLVLPAPNTIYLGVVEDRQGDYPAAGIFAESTTITPLTSAEYLLEYRYAVTISVTAGAVGAVDPSQVYAAAQAYISSACECLSTHVARGGVPYGIYDSSTISAAAERSPHVVQTTPESHYETRRALGRVRVLQTLRREVPL